MPEPKPFLDQVVDFLASVKLALFILVALALASVVGTIVPQNLAPEQYLQEYGPGMFTFLRTLNVYDLYHAAWFNLLLAALVLNLTVCSFKRLPASIRLARPVNPDKLSPDFLLKQKNARTIHPTEMGEDAEGRIKKALGLAFTRPGETDRDFGKLYWSESGRLSRFGVYVVHFSIFFIVAGAVIGNLGGFSAELVLNEGESAAKVSGRRPAGTIDLPFTIRLDEFTVKYYDTGAPSEYRSDVTLIEDGKEVHQAAIRVNHPLTWHGITFYQSSIGKNLDGPIEFTLMNKTDGRSFPLKLRPGFRGDLPDKTGQVGVAEVTDDLHGHGPAAQIIVRENDGSTYSIIAMQNQTPERPEPEGPWDARLDRMEISYYTGLQVNKDPGVWFVWIGCGLMMIGFLITFFVAHRKTFVAVIREDRHPRLILAGSAHRNAGAYKIKFDRLADDLAEALGDSGK